MTSCIAKGNCVLVFVSFSFAMNAKPKHATRHCCSGIAKYNKIFLSIFLARVLRGGKVFLSIFPLPELMRERDVNCSEKKWLRNMGNIAQWLKATKNQDVSACLSIDSFAYLAYSFTHFALLASLVHSTELICSLACSLTHSQACGKV